MKSLTTSSLLLAAILLVTSSLSALNPKEKASLYKHLCEVNKEWLNIKPDQHLQEVVSFKNEQARIQAHLNLVEQHLRENAPALSPSLAAQRASSLEALNAYWRHGSFPINTFHSYRIPYFIDVIGTPCAVGQLIISSGHQDLAERISGESNYAYIREMNYPELDQWVQESGFTVNELAWIQPGYPPVASWSADGVKIEGDVNVFLTANDGSKEILYAAGEFDEVEGINGMNNIAAFDGTTWSKLGSGLDGHVNALIMFAGMLYAGGEFQIAEGDFRANAARWTGTKWEPAGDGFNGPVNAFAIYEGKLYAGGAFSSSARVCKYMAVFNGFGWDPLQQEVNGEVHALLSHSTGLVAAGEFTMTGSTPASHIAKFSSGSWQSMGEGVEAPVYALAEFDGKIYSGGLLQDEKGNYPDGFAYWDGTAWTAGDILSGNSINNFITHNNKLYVVGDFTFSPMIGTYGQNILEMSLFSSQGMATMRGSLKASATFQEKLFFGGSIDSLFAQQEWMEPGAIMYTSSPNAIVEQKPVSQSIIPYPNPSSEKFYIDFPSVSDYDLTLYNLTGQAVQNITGTGKQVVVSHENLNSGVYIYYLKADGQPAINGRIAIVAPSAY